MPDLPLRPLRVLLVATVVGSSATALGNSEPANLRRYLPLGTARAMAARPRVCEGAASTDGLWAAHTLGWKQARESDTARRCARLAQGLTLVTQDPQTILDWFQHGSEDQRRVTVGTRDLADTLVLAERALVARALLRTGHLDEAYTAFSAIVTVVPMVQWHVFTVHDFAVAAARTGRFDVAGTCYRRLLSVASWLPRAMKINVLLEASAALLHASPPAASEVLSYLADLDDESLGPDLRAVGAGLRLAAKSVLDPNTPLALPQTMNAQPGLQSTLRLADEDARFVQALVTYHATGQISVSSSSEASGSSFSVPAYVAVVSRIRGS